MAGEKKKWVIRVIPGISTDDKDFKKILEEIKGQCIEWGCEVFVGSDHPRDYDAAVTVLRGDDGRVKLVSAVSTSGSRQTIGKNSPEGLVVETLKLIVDNLVLSHTKKR